MIKDVLVHIPTERQMRPVVDGAVSLAAAYGAHLDAVAIGYISESTAYVMDGGAAVVSVIEMERERAKKRAEAALALFETEARNAGIAYACRADSAFPGEAAASLGTAARVYDLAVVLQPDADEKTFDNSIAQEIMLQSGGPVLFIPYVFRGAFKAKRIGVCWDGSRVAARALRDAAPFLAQAEAVMVVTVNEPNSGYAEASAERLAEHLARIGRRPEKVAATTASRSDIQPTILSWAAEESLDLLVMGGYGHSRLQETVLGGVTRATIQAMTVPTLMSH
ncbi:universal stress protein [Bradyrhizobium sp.]|uniref:universal stress protein n=1 Tax=Bradyrhizobium sp. TaxID=376 RepID=UPI003C310FAE